MRPSHSHRSSCLTALLVLWLSATLAAALPAAPQQAKQVKQYTIEQFLDTDSIFGSSFSPDEKYILFSSDDGGIFNAWRVAASGGEPEQVTTSQKESTYAVSYFPDDPRLLYTHDQGGNENDHLYLREQDGSERDLTPGEKLKAQFYGWSHDLKSFYYGTNQRDARYFDVFRMDADALKPSLVYENNDGYTLGAVSPDGRRLALHKVKGEHDSDIYLYDAEAKKLTHITPHEGQVQNDPQDFDAEGKSLYFLTNQGSEFSYVARYDLAGGKTEPVEKAGWDIVSTYFSHNGKYRVTVINEDGSSKVIVYDTASGKPIELPELPQGEIRGVNISRSEKLMAFYVNGDTSPSNLYVYDFVTGSARRLTEALSPEIDAADLVEGNVVRYESFDGMKIPAILYRPHQASAENPLPAMVEVHGGPGGQSRKGYSAYIQYLVNHGYTVLRVNNRGSSGYGKTFYAADDRRHGKEPLRDVVVARKYLESLPYVDKRRIAVMGGSYGGYMVLAALAFHPQAFDAGVDIFGVSNWVRTLDSIPPYWESFRQAIYEEIGDPSKDEAMLREISPLFHADKIARPLLVLQGKNDPRVIKPESDEIVEAVKKKGGTVEYVVFDDEGHGFSKKKNRITGYRSIREFLDRYLKGAEEKTGAN